MRLFLLFWCAWQALAQGTTEEILKTLSGISGLAVLKPVQQQTMARDQLKGYFEERIKEVVKPEEIRIEELGLKKMGFAPKDFDLKKTTVELMAEQAAAFYDYRKKRMVLLAGQGDGMQEMALVHELAHALADQHFQLEKYLKKAGSSDDGSLARMAVMEGQATWLMSEAMAQKMGQSLIKNDAMVDMMARMASSGGSGFPIFQSVPLYMRESLVFPYGAGMRFQHKVTAKMGKDGFAEVFRRPPGTTQEILHPEKYLAKSKAEIVKAPELARPAEWKELATGTSGEFDHMILLRQYAPQSELLAESWRGGVYKLWESKKDKSRASLAYASVWADEESARKFFQAYEDVLKKKFARCEFTEKTAAKMTGKSEDGWFVTRLEGRRVSSFEGVADLAEVK
jgi:hypothetical protein